MKKIFFALVAIFGLWSCVQEDLPPVGPTIVDSEGGYVDVTFGVSLPDMKEVTRSMTSPQITSLHLLVFNEQGMLCDKRNATPCKENGSTTDEDGNEIPTDDLWGETSALTYFKVQLERTGMPRTIHLIANSPTAFDEYPVSSETSVITSLSVSGGQEAYWQRLEFPDGITGTPVRDDDGNQLFDENGPRFEPSADVKSKLTAVPMIRNYSRIEVVNASSGNTALTDVEFVLVNIPDRGSVAPYNINMGQFEAMDDSTDYEKLVKDNDVHKPYTGYEPAGRQLMNNTFDGSGALVDASNSVITPTTATVGTIDTDGNISRTTDDPNYLYLYERNQTLDTDNQTYVIVKGKYAGTANSQPTYYKVAIAKEDKDGYLSYNLLRNIQYTIVITGAVGEGFLTAEAAYGAGASNLLNYDVTTKNLTQISDGTKSLYVEYTQKVITADKAKVTLRYKYETSSSEDKLITDSVKITKLPYSVGEVISGDIADGDGTTDSDGWNTLSFTAGTTPSAGSTGYSQKIKLEIAGLVREVEYILSSRYYLQLQMPEKVGSDINSLVAAKLLLQKDLHRGVFPLEFTIVAENNSLSPLNFGNNLQLSTVTNVNADGTPGGNNFGYSVTLDRLRYEAMVKALGEDDQYVTIPLYFVTNMANAAKAIGEQKSTDQKDAENNGTKVRVYNPYFEPDFSQFWIDKLYGLSLAATPYDSTTATTSFKINTSNQSITLLDGEYIDFDILSEHKLTGVTNSNGVAVSGASIVNSGKTLRINKAAYDAARNYTLTFSSAPNNIIDTTIIISNAEFGAAIAKVQKFGISWNIGYYGYPDYTQTNLSSGQNYTLRIKLPAGIPAELLSTLKINVASENSNVQLNGTTYDDGSVFSIPTSGYNSASGSNIDITLNVTAGSSGTRTFSLTLTGAEASFDMPTAISKTYSNRSYR